MSAVLRKGMRCARSRTLDRNSKSFDAACIVGTVALGPKESGVEMASAFCILRGGDFYGILGFAKKFAVFAKSGVVLTGVWECESLQWKERCGFHF